MNPIASPSTRAYAREHGVDLDALARATGRVSIGREDVARHLAGGARAGPARSDGDPARFWDVDHAAFGPVTLERLSRPARVAADLLGAGNALIPQVTHHDRADMRAVEAFRTGPGASGEGVRITALAFHVKVLARCLRDFPRFNASLSRDGDALVLKGYVHIGIAVDTPHGLLVPVIRDADRKGLALIAAEIADLASRARERRIRPHELGGASMTISNLGGIGGTGFTPLVNPPEAAIMGISRTEVVAIRAGDTWEPVPMAPLSLSYDHRIINGADAARFVKRYADLISNPYRLLM